MQDIFMRDDIEIIFSVVEIYIVIFYFWIRYWDIKADILGLLWWVVATHIHQSIYFF